MEQLSLEIGKRLTELRKSNHLTQQEVADKIDGLTIQMISAYENGKQKPGIENLIKFSNFFQISLDFICTGKKEQNEAFKIETYGDFFRQLLRLVSSNVCVFELKDESFKNGEFCWYPLATRKPIVKEFYDKYRKLVAAKDVMGVDLFEMSLKGLIESYDNLPIENEN